MIFKKDYLIEMHCNRQNVVDESESEDLGKGRHESYIVFRFEDKLYQLTIDWTPGWGFEWDEDEYECPEVGPHEEAITTTVTRYFKV